MTAFGCMCVLLLLTYHANAYFDCGRDGSQCKHDSKCKLNDGKCNCEGKSLAAEGYDCSIVTGGINDGSACNSDFSCNNGVCYKGTDTNGYCLCDENWTGDNCNLRRYELVCDSANNQMTMTIRPHIPTFTGIVYMQGKLKSCQFKGDPLTKANVPDTDSACGNADTSNAGTKVRKVVIQFTGGMKIRRDELVTFTCGVAGDVVNVDVANFNVDSVDGSLRSAERNLNPESGDVDMVLKSEGKVISKTVNLGVEVEVTLALTEQGLSKYSSLRLVDCYATNLLAVIKKTPYISKAFFENNCVSPDLFGVLKGNFRGSKVAKVFDFDAFKYTGFSKLYIKCKVKVCHVDAECDDLSCKPETRKRRAVEGDTEDLARSFEIKDPYALQAVLIGENVDDTPCNQTQGVTLTVVSLSVCLLLVLIICVLLAVRVMLNRRTSHTCKGDEYNYNSNAYLSQSTRSTNNKC